jgi:hypothetical protein
MMEQISQNVWVEHTKGHTRFYTSLRQELDTHEALEQIARDHHISIIQARALVDTPHGYHHLRKRR